MKIKKGIGIGIVSISLLGLFGCGGEQSQTQQDGNQAQNNETTEPEHSQQDHNQQQPEDSNQDKPTTPTDDKSESGSTGQDQSTTPQTEQEALKQIASKLNTRAPIMLPTDVPIGQGNFLTAITNSETWYYNVQLFETKEPTDIDSQATSKGSLLATVEGTVYKDEASAKAAVGGYIQVDASQGNAIDLGHTIQGVMSGAAGHVYIVWNEGRWCIKLDSPTDPAYQNSKYPDSKKLAENIVTYLHDNALPAPYDIGVITIHNWKNSNGTTIQWQHHETVYQVTSQDPMIALKIAVAME